MSAEPIPQPEPRRENVPLKGFSRRFGGEDQRGFSLVEMLVTISIFSVIMGGAYSAFLSQMKHSTREYNVAGAEIEVGIVKSLFERDIATAGYGLATNYDTLAFNPRAVEGADGEGFEDSDTLTMRGTALGINSRQTMGWTYMTDTGDFKTWGDVRENVAAGDRIIVMDPETKRLLWKLDSDNVKQWLFEYNGTDADPTAPLASSATAFSGLDGGTLLYGLYGDPGSDTSSEATQPYYAVKYYLPDDAGSNDPGVCAPGTRNLLRAESRKSEDPDSGDPLLACVLDFQVAFGLDTDEDGTIDDWDEAGDDHANDYDVSDLRKRLKQVRTYILVQAGSPDPDYTYPSSSIRVGEDIIDTGETLTLTAAQRRYRWKLFTLSITPKNLK